MNQVRQIQVKRDSFTRNNRQRRKEKERKGKREQKMRIYGMMSSPDAWTGREEIKVKPKKREWFKDE